MEARYPGKEIRTRDAIEQTAVVVIATLVKPGAVSPGPPGAQHIDNAGFRVERALSPAESSTPPVSGNVRVWSMRQVFPEARAQAPLKRGKAYVLFCTILAPHRLHALKIVPHSEDAVRIVATAFTSGARHGTDPASSRLA